MALYIYTLVTSDGEFTSRGEEQITQDGLLDWLEHVVGDFERLEEFVPEYHDSATDCTEWAQHAIRG